MTRKEKAMEIFESGYNCSQAVALAFQDLTNIDEETLSRMASSFGGGMGRMREVCGAVSGMFIIAGLLYGFDKPEEGKTDHYARIQELANEFKKENGSIVCRTLLGLDGPQSPTPDERTKEYYQKRPCVELVGQATEILEKYIRDNPIEK